MFAVYLYSEINSKANYGLTMLEAMFIRSLNMSFSMLVLSYTELIRSILSDFNNFSRITLRSLANFDRFR